MNALATKEMRMVAEDRIARLESDVAEVKGDVKTLNSRVSEIQADLQDFKINVAKEFASARAELGDFKTEVAKEFGRVRTEMKESFGSLRTSIESTKVWVLTTGLATLLGVAAIVGLKSH